jgi:hypothetical protein
MLRENVHYLDWVHLKAPVRSYQLCAEKREILTLTWQSVRDTTAVAKSATDSWLFMCTGYLIRQAAAYTHPARRILGTFKPVTNTQENLLCGAFQMHTGEAFTLKRAHPMRPEMVWEDEAGNPMMHFKGDFMSNAKTGEVQVMHRLPEQLLRKAPLLMSFGWYLMVSAHVDMALIF